MLIYLTFFLLPLASLFIASSGHFFPDSSVPLFFSPNPVTASSHKLHSSLPLKVVLLFPTLQGCCSLAYFLHDCCFTSYFFTSLLFPGPLRLVSPALWVHLKALSTMFPGAGWGFLLPRPVFYLQSVSYD